MYLARKKEDSLYEIFTITYPNGEKDEVYLDRTSVRELCERSAKTHNWKYVIDNETITFTELPKEKSIEIDGVKELQKGFNLTREQALQARIIQLEYKLKGLEQMHKNELDHIRAMHQAELLRKDQEIEKIRNDKEAENTQKLISGLLNGGLFSNQI